MVKLGSGTTNDQSSLGTSAKLLADKSCSRIAEDQAKHNSRCEEAKTRKESRIVACLESSSTTTTVLSSLADSCKMYQQQQQPHYNSHPPSYSSNPPTYTSNPLAEHYQGQLPPSGSPVVHPQQYSQQAQTQYAQQHGYQSPPMQHGFDSQAPPHPPSPPAFDPNWAQQQQVQNNMAQMSLQVS